MGRAASITVDDVATARARLRGLGLAHGIIAIRNELGRGSPQLISRYLRELDDAPKPPTLESPLDSSGNLGDHLLRKVAAELAEHLREQNAAAPGSEHETTSPAQGEELATLRAENAALQREINRLAHELEAQRTLYDDYRRDHIRDRAAIVTQIEHLGRELSGRTPPPTPPTKAKLHTQQLDLYAQD